MSLVPQPSQTPPTANESLAQTLAIGNLTLANDIVVSNPQKIDFAGNISLRNNTGGGGTDVIINSIPANVGPLLTQGVFYDTATNRVVHQLQNNENLAQTLAIGNTTGPNDIVVSNTQKISYVGDIEIQGGVGADVIINAIPVAPVPQPVELCYDVANSKVYYQTPNTFNAGTGILFSGPITNQTISATGLVGLTPANAGTGIAITGVPSNPIISNSGVVSVASGGAGISITGTAQNPVVNNTGLVSLTGANAGANITITGTPTFPIITGVASAPSIANSALAQSFSDTNQNVDNNGPYQIETSVGLQLPTSWTQNKSWALITLSVQMTQVLTILGGFPPVAPVVETITFSFGDIATINPPIVPITITNNTGMTTNGQTYTNTYTATFMANMFNINPTPVIVYINAINNIPQFSGFTTYTSDVVNTYKGWCSVIPLS